MKRNLIDASQLELEDKVVSIKRVTKVVKGGRNFRFTALVVVGDGNGHVGAGLGKAAEIPEAIRKGKEDAMKKLVTVAINRVAKVVKGGRTFRFSAVVVVGDENGHVGVGNGKASEVPDAIRKAIEEAKKNLIEVPVVGTTIPHEYIGKFGSASVLLKPAAEGTGLIAGGSVRPVLELAGYRDIRTKVIGTNNPRNVVYATLEGLKSMKTAEQIAKKRGKTVAEIL